VAIFAIGVPVVIVTDRELKGWVTGIDIPHVGVIAFAPQTFRGQKGWVASLTRPWEGGGPSTYEVAFRICGNPRTVIVHHLEEERSEITERTQQVDDGRGHFWDVKTEDLALDPEPEGTFDQLQEERYEAGEFDLDPIDVLSEADHYLEAREAALHPELYLQRWRETLPGVNEQWLQMKLEQHQAEWRRFTEASGPSVFAFIQSYIESEDAGRLDWTSILSAIEQAERGSRTTFDLLLEQVYIQGSSILPLSTGRPDPGVPTTACFNCDAVVPVSETWVSRIDGHALCDSCFTKAEAAGRAKRPRSERKI
jgi:hypothetical protein